MKCDDVTALPLQGASSVEVIVVRAAGVSRVQDWVAEEQPVALEFNGVSHAVMLASPGDLEDFALGFSLTEGIIDAPNQLFGLEISESPTGTTLHIEIATRCFAALKEKRRNLTGRTGCGLCGTESLSQVLRPMSAINTQAAPIAGQTIELALDCLHMHQRLQQQTGATHAAAWFDIAGQLKFIREDVGRHNALDKLIGAGLRSRDPSWREGILVVTSRASMEMVQKTIAAGFSILVAVSAPTRLAIDLAKQHGVCLIGFARPGKWTIYSHATRVNYGH